MMWEMAGHGAFPQFSEKFKVGESAGIEEKRKEQIAVKNHGKKKSRLFRDNSIFDTKIS
jgi:hypothetical protein